MGNPIGRITNIQEAIVEAGLHDDEMAKDVRSGNDAKPMFVGNYLLSKERAKSVDEINKGIVTHADIENWKAKHG